MQLKVVVNVLIAFMMALIVSLITALVAFELGASWADTLRPAGFTFVGLLGLLMPLINILSLESAEVRESREQVREAERGLEAALSEAASTPGEGTTETPDEADHDAEEARGLALARLWSLTHRQLDLYHKIATRQARMSFWSAQLAMFIGFGLLGVFVKVAYNTSTTAGAIVAGGLGTVSAALAGFISKTFVRSQETAAGHLKAYFDQPLEMSRFLAAERLVADSGMTQEQRAAITAELARAIVARPGATPDAGGNATKPEGNGAASSG
jgi:hypothetical protein